MPPRALLLDFDGVIADTENVHVAAWQRTFGALGWEESDETCSRAAEVDDRAFLADVFARRKVDGGDVDGWVKRKQELTAALLADAPRVFPGVADLVRRLDGRAALAVVSTSWRANIEAVLNAAGLREAFNVVVGKEDVKAPKPDPEPYKLALRALKVPAGEAVAVEDSAAGVASARGAGVRVVAVGHRRAAGDWSAGADFLDDLRRTDAVLAALGFD